LFYLASVVDFTIIFAGMEMDETNTATSADTSTDTQSNIRTYEAPWLIYGMSFSFNYQHGYRLAIGSFIEAVDNKIEIL
jgi:hypothetical protein